MEETDDGLTPEQLVIMDAYLRTFSSSFGRIVLEDLRKSFVNKPIDEGKLNSLGHLAARAAEKNVVHKIERMMSRAAAEIERTEGVKPASQPKVILESIEAEENP